MKQPHRTEMYAALDLFRHRCLGKRHSIGLPDEHPLCGQVWTAAAAEELVRCFVESPDESKRSFFDKLRDQTAGASAAAHQLLVELAWLHLVVSTFYRPDTKRRLLSQFAALGGATLPTGPFDDALETGLVRTGTSFNTRRPNQLWLLIRFAAAWTALEPDEQQRLLSDPWAFHALVFGLDGVADQTQRHALIHLVHPDTFEASVSQYHKRAILDALAPGEDFESLDHGLFRLRARLEADTGETVDFYGPALRPLWDPDADSDAARADDPGTGPGMTDDADPNEADPNEADIDCQAWLLRGSGGERVPEWLHRGIGAIYFEETFPFDLTPGLSRDQLRAKADERGIDTTAGGFSAELGQVWRFVNEIAPGDLVLTVNGQELYLGVVASGPRSRSSGRGRRETTIDIEWINAGQPVLRSDVSAALYSKLRTLLTLTNITSVVDELSRWSRGDVPGDSVDSEPAPKVSIAPPSAELASALLLDKRWLHDITELLNEKRQIVLYGPPGTGKTYLARALAEHATAEGGSWEVIQFHPSYTYEDFFEGYRPVASSGGQIGFEIKPGPLRRLARVAHDNPHVPHLLIIDEINRANLAKVFGELYFLLEYRNTAIALQYSDEEFTLPENLFIIGTMNTADRSIALIDAAMRRRFYFAELSPATPPIDRLLRRWLADPTRNLSGKAADLLDALNAAIGDRDALVGPSFFMQEGIDEPARLRRIWDHSILPLLAERFYGTPDEDLARFQLDRLLSAVEPAPPA